MPKLLTAVPISFPAGRHNVKMVMTSGDARIQWAVDGVTFSDVPGTVKTADDGFSIDLPNCRIQSVITGDAVVDINKVSR